MQNKLKSVIEFHEAFGLGVSKNPTIDLREEITNLRFRLMAEENEEYLEAVKNKNMI